MPKVADKVLRVRSKNAGPFWVTVDVFCGGPAAFNEVRRLLKTETVAQLFQTPTQLVKRFDIADLGVIKFSFPRPIVQGSRDDRDMHGAQYAVLLAELEV